MFKITTIILSVVFCLNLVNNNATSTENVNNILVEQDTDFIEPKIIHNAEVGIFPGEDGTKLFVPKDRISPTDLDRDFIVTGLQSAEDGKEIIIYATIGSIELLPNNLNSLPENRIEQSFNMTVYQGQFAELIYNANIGKWIITNIE